MPCRSSSSSKSSKRKRPQLPTSSRNPLKRSRSSYVPPSSPIADAPNQTLCTLQLDRDSSRVEMLRMFQDIKFDFIDRCDEVYDRLLDTEWTIGRIARSHEEMVLNFRIMVRKVDDLERQFEWVHCSPQGEVEHP